MAATRPCLARVNGTYRLVPYSRGIEALVVQPLSFLDAPIGEVVEVPNRSIDGIGAVDHRELYVVVGCEADEQGLVAQRQTGARSSRRGRSLRAKDYVDLGSRAWSRLT